MSWMQGPQRGTSRAPSMSWRQGQQRGTNRESHSHEHLRNFEKIDEGITQLTVGQVQVWAVIGEGKVCWRHNERDSYWRMILDFNFDVLQMSVGPQGALYAVSMDGKLYHRDGSDNLSISGNDWTEIEIDAGKAKLVTVTNVAIFVAVASHHGEVFRMLLDKSSGKPKDEANWEKVGEFYPVSMSSHPVTGKVYVVDRNGRFGYLGVENGPTEIDDSNLPTALWKWVDWVPARVSAKTISNTRSEVMRTDKEGNVFTLPLDPSSTPTWRSQWKRHREIDTPVKALSAFGEQTWLVNESGEVFAKGLPGSNDVSGRRGNNDVSGRRRSRDGFDGFARRESSF